MTERMHCRSLSRGLMSHDHLDALLNDLPLVVWLLHIFYIWLVWAKLFERLSVNKKIDIKQIL